MNCPCCEFEMHAWEWLVSRRTGKTGAVLWRCPRCAEPDEYMDEPHNCECEADGEYYEMPPGAELQHGGRHLL